MTKAGELPYMTKVHYSMNKMEKAMRVLRYVKKTFFKIRYARIAYIMRLL